MSARKGGVAVVKINFKLINKHNERSFVRTRVCFRIKRVNISQKRTGRGRKSRDFIKMAHIEMYGNIKLFIM